MKAPGDLKTTRLFFFVLSQPVVDADSVTVFSVDISFFQPTYVAHVNDFLFIDYYYYY